MDPKSPEEAQPQKVVKPGFLTTEFWLTAAATIAGLALDVVPGPWKLVPIVAYTISRGLAKH